MPLDDIRSLRKALKEREEQLRRVTTERDALRSLLGVPDGSSAAGPSPSRREKALREVACRDALTGLLNRRGLDAALANLWSGRGEVALLVLDLDRFKAINDQHGHAAGDLVLRECSAVLRGHLRGGDVLGRLGGDEWLVALPSSGERAARLIGKRLLEAVRAQAFRCRGKTLRVTLSAGAAWALLDPGMTAEALFDRADRALLRAKREGRDRLRCRNAGKRRAPGDQEADGGVSRKRAGTTPSRRG